MIRAKDERRRQKEKNRRKKKKPTTAITRTKKERMLVFLCQLCTALRCCGLSFGARLDRGRCRTTVRDWNEVKWRWFPRQRQAEATRRQRRQSGADASSGNVIMATARRASMIMVASSSLWSSTPLNSKPATAYESAQTAVALLFACVYPDDTLTTLTHQHHHTFAIYYRRCCRFALQRNNGCHRCSAPGDGSNSYRSRRRRRPSQWARTNRQWRSNRRTSEPSEPVSQPPNQPVAERMNRRDE